MKTIKSIIYVICMITMVSCIKEDLSDCPYMGLYRVHFYDSLKHGITSPGNTTICYTTDKGENTVIPIIYKNLPDSSYLLSNNTCRLAPGEYTFFALYSTIVQEPATHTQMQNGFIYMFAVARGIVKKQKTNLIPLLYKPLNSMIAINCILSNQYSLAEDSASNYTVTQAEITPPSENNSSIDLYTGKCNHETSMSPYFSKCIYNKERNLWTYNCNPVLAGNTISIKVTLYDTLLYKTTVLHTRVFINTNINQGEVYHINLDVTPSNITAIDGGIYNWQNYISDSSIVLNTAENIQLKTINIIYHEKN